MKKRRRYRGLVIAGLMVCGLLCGCRHKNPFHIDPEQVMSIWMDTMPANLDSVRFTEDPATIESIAGYIHGLELRPATAFDQQLAGRGILIEILFQDGTRREFSHGANVYFGETGQPDLYVMKREQGEAFSALYEKTPAPELRKGTVLEVHAGKDGRQSMLVDVVPNEQGFLAGETIVSVETRRIFQTRYYDCTQVNVGDEIGFYPEGYATLSLPPMCGAWKVYVLKEAQPKD